MYIFFPNTYVCTNIVTRVPISWSWKTPVTISKHQHVKILYLFRRLLQSIPHMRMSPLGFKILENLSVVNIIPIQKGHPFTIGRNTIVLPLSYFRLPVRLQTKILIHELVHLHQRRVPKLYHAYYTEHFGFKKEPFFNLLPPDLKKKLMYNPDGEHYEWIWRNRYIPLGINHKAFLWDLKTKKLQPVANVPEYGAFFQTRQLYHPNEIIAHQITDALHFDGH